MNIQTTEIVYFSNQSHYHPFHMSLVGFQSPQHLHNLRQCAIVVENKASEAKLVSWNMNYPAKHKLCL